MPARRYRRLLARCCTRICWLRRRTDDGFEDVRSIMRACFFKCDARSDRIVTPSPGLTGTSISPADMAIGSAIMSIPSRTLPIPSVEYKGSIAAARCRIEAIPGPRSSLQPIETPIPDLVNIGPDLFPHSAWSRERAALMLICCTRVG